MTDCLFVKIVSDMNRNHISQRDQQQDWCWNNVLMNNNIETAHNKLTVSADSNKKVFLAKSLEGDFLYEPKHHVAYGAKKLRHLMQAATQRQLFFAKKS